MLKFDPNEIQFVKAAIEAVTIRGKDAKFVATILDKLDKEWVKVPSATEKNKKQIIK